MVSKYAPFALVAAFSAGSWAHAADVSVASPAELTAAIGAAAAGDRILLAPGHYGTLVLNGAHFSAPVTIESRDLRDIANFSAVYLNDARGILLANVRIEYGATKSPLTTYAVNILSSTDISLNGLEVSSAANGVAGDDAYGVNVRDSTRVVVRDCRIHDVYRAVAVLDSNDVELAGNDIAGVGSDGVVARGAVRLSIIGNYFSDFAIIDPEIQHPDAIQLWSRDAPRASRDIVIRGNLIRRGSGDPSQGIFVKTPELATANLLIEENVIEQSMGQGIFVENGADVLIRKNTVLPHDFRVDRPGVEVRGVGAGVTVSENLAIAYRLADGAVGSGNVSVDYFNPWIAPFVGNHIADPAAPATPDDFAPLGPAGASRFVKDIWIGDPGAPPGSLAPPYVIADLLFDEGAHDRAPEPVSISVSTDTSGARYYVSDPAPTLSAAMNLSIESRAALPSGAAGWRLLAATPNSYDVRIDRSRIRFSIWTQAGVTRLDGVSPALLDLASHEIILRYDGATGAMSIALDGVDIARKVAPTGPIAYNPTQRLYVAGAPWGLFFGDGIERLKITR